MCADMQIGWKVKWWEQVKVRFRLLVFTKRNKKQDDYQSVNSRIEIVGI